MAISNGKHKPAVALPTVESRTFRGHTSYMLKWSDGFESAMPSAEIANRLKHRDLAYPLLVEDLHGLLGYLEEMAKHDRSRRAEHCVARAIQTRDLLRSLGEDA